MNPLETGTEEYKYYCKQVKGFALEIGVADGERIELVGITGQNMPVNMDASTRTKMETLITLLKQLIALLQTQRGY
jgi:hypothetical protein